ncbi:AraC family transcriptional regulator [Paenibacillus sp. CC-CFT747]|nr:AraC family transcriptional regulator [Paenibacillus sp. CC-CFT747]
MRPISFFTKMIVFGCILCTLPVLFLGFISYQQSAKEFQKQVNRSQAQLLGQMNSKVEETLLTINHALNQLINSNTMAKALNEPYAPDHFEMYNSLRKEISSTQSFYTKLDDVVIINFQKNWMIKNSGYYRFDEYLHHAQIYGERLMPRETTWMLNPTVWFYSEEKANAISCPYTISLIKKLPVKALEKDGLAYANLSACGIADILHYTPQPSETVMILDERGQLQYHSNPALIGQYAADTGFLPDMSVLSHASGQFETSRNGERYTATYLKSDFNGWIYVSVISLDRLLMDTKKIANYTILVCVLIILTFVGVTLIGSRRMYSPIGRLMNQLAERLPGKENGRKANEFEIIGDRMQALYQSNSALEHEVQHHLQQARTFFLLRLYQGSVRRSDLAEKLELFGLGEKAGSWTYMAVLTLQIDSLEKTHYGKEDSDLLLFAINNMIEELIPPETRFPPIFIEQTQVTLIGTAEPDKEAFADYLYRTTESIQQKVREVLKLGISIGLSLPFEEVRAASIAYREGHEALKQRIQLGSSVIIQYADVNSGRHQLAIDYPSGLESELVDAITLAEEEPALVLLGRFMLAVFRHELTLQEYQVSVNRLLNKLLGVMQESGISLHQLDTGGSSLYEELNRIQLADEMEAWFRKRLLLPLIAIFRERRNSQYRNISEQVIDRIVNHYDTNLTIESCAAELHYNANYLSGVFRKETNQTFSEYLLSYRLHMAKKWLKETDMTIKEIAERLQYLNSQNFIRSFRKQEDMTPGQYREKYGRAD